MRLRLVTGEKGSGPFTSIVLVALSAGWGCGTKASIGTEGPSLSQIKPENGGAVPAPAAASIPVPKETDPKLAPTALVVPVMAAPARGAQTVGYLRLGSKVARSPEPVGRDGCQDGWYAIRPAGFVCPSEGATVKLDHPLVRAIGVEPSRVKPMPYPYAFVRAIAPNYLRVPSKDE